MNVVIYDCQWPLISFFFFQIITHSHGGPLQTKEWKHSCLSPLSRHPFCDANLTNRRLDYATCHTARQNRFGFGIFWFLYLLLRDKDDERSRSVVMHAESFVVDCFTKPFPPTNFTVLLQLHRQLFTRALIGRPEEVNRKTQVRSIGIVAVVLGASLAW